MADNSKALENGFNKAKQIIREQVEKGLMVQANKLVEKIKNKMTIKMYLKM